ncbi:MAG: hypothetical protein AAFQ98_09685 [Bacteroidota bacterium]
MAAETFQNILYLLSKLPEDRLREVHQYLETLSDSPDSKEGTAKAVMTLAGDWSDWEDEEYETFLNRAKSAGESLFNPSSDFS